MEPWIFCQRPGLKTMENKRGPGKDNSAHPWVTRLAGVAPYPTDDSSESHGLRRDNCFSGKLYLLGNIPHLGATCISRR